MVYAEVVIYSNELQLMRLGSLKRAFYRLGM